MGYISGVVVGTVKKVNDPNGEGRVLVQFPWMGGNNERCWETVATLMSGGCCGSWFMPEEEDEVLVAFDHDDVNHPYILGFLWNGKDKPPETSSHKRMIKTVKGHTILWDDTDGSEKIEIVTGGGHRITLDDTSAGESITLKTVGGNQSITLSDVTSSIELQGGGRNLKMSNGLVQIS